MIKLIQFSNLRVLQPDPGYVDVIVQQRQETTGGGAWLNGSRKHFAASIKKPQAADGKIG
jgi:hypothetical protein